MAINIEWVNNKQTVVKLEFPQLWTWEEVYEVKRQLDAGLDQVDHDCAVLFVLPSNTKLPMNALSNGLRILNDSHPRIRLFMIVTPSLFVRSVTEMVRKVSTDIRNRSRVVETIDQAHEALIEAGYLTVRDRIGT
jgi:hypothetical protein